MKCGNYIRDAIDDGTAEDGQTALVDISEDGQDRGRCNEVPIPDKRNAEWKCLPSMRQWRGADRETVCALMKCFTTKEALDILEERGLWKRRCRP